VPEVPGSDTYKTVAELRDVGEQVKRLLAAGSSYNWPE